MRVGAVIITMGNRPDELRALLDSVAKQDGDPVEVVVVGNGSPVPDVPEGVPAHPARIVPTITATASPPVRIDPLVLISSLLFSWDIGSVIAPRSCHRANAPVHR